MVLDAVTYAKQFVDYFVDVYVLVILLYVIISWIRLPYSFNPLQRFIHEVCDPYLRLWRRVLPSFGPLDLSPIVAIIGLYILRYLIDELLNRLH